MAEVESKDASSSVKPQTSEPNNTTKGVFFVPKEEVVGQDENLSQDEVREGLRQAGVKTENSESKDPFVQQFSPKSKIWSTLLRPLRTYKDDVAEVLRETKGSKISIRTAEEERKMQRLKKEQERILTEEKIQKERERIQKERARLEAEKKHRRPPEEKRERTERNPLEYKEPGERERLAATTSPTPPPLNIDTLKEEERELKKAEREFEKKKREDVNNQPVKLKDPSERRANATLVVISLLLMALGGGVLYGAYSIFFASEPKSPQLDIKTLVFAEEEVKVTVNEMGETSLLQRLADEKNAVTFPSGNLINLGLIERTAGKNPTEETYPILLLMAQIAKGAPESLLRSIGSDYMLGIHTFDRNEIFLILKPTFYENAFAGMLAWESVMLEDLAPLLGAVNVQTRNTPAFSNTFEDKVIENKDTRVRYDSRGEIVLLYSFVSRDTLIIASNKSTFLEVLNRMNSKRVSE